MSKTDYFMLLPIAFNAVLMAGYAYEMNWWKACYFLGAFVINIAVFGMRGPA